MKFALVSHNLPPSWGGQAVILSRILQGINPDNYCLISLMDGNGEAHQGEKHNGLPANHYYLPPEPRMKRGGRFGMSKLRVGFNVSFGIALRAKRILSIIKREQCQAVVACTGELLDLPSAYLASRLAGVPFYAYVFDYYSYQWLDPTARFFAQHFEPVILKGAAGVIVLNEFLRDELHKRYGVEATLIRNPCDLEGLNATGVGILPQSSEIKIVYTGAVYDAHYDAFRNLITAIKLLDWPNLKLHLYSPSLCDWEAEGISGPVVRHQPQAASEIYRIQQEAELLFLPLAFNSPYPKLVNTSAPTKLGEYLIAGRPILVHAPHDSFLSWYFKQHQCGAVVDHLDPQKLADALKKVLTDVNLQQQLSKRARERAMCDFDIHRARFAFAKLMKLGSFESGVGEGELVSHSEVS